MDRVHSSDVLDATHEVVASFRATVLGAFRRVGPNSWDDYEFVRRATTRSAAPGDASVLEVLPRVPVQLESRGAEVRMRSEGKVLRVRFLPSDGDVVALSVLVGEAFDAKNHARALRQYLQENYLRALGQTVSLGAAGVIAQKLNQT